MVHDYGAKTSLREAVADYQTEAYFQESDVLDTARRLDRRLLDCLNKFLDDHGVNASEQIELANKASIHIRTIQSGNAVVGGQGNIIVGHGAVNNFGATVYGSGSMTADSLDSRGSTRTHVASTGETAPSAAEGRVFTTSPTRSDDVPPGMPLPPGMAPPGEPRQRYLLGQCPDTVAPEQPFSLLVRVTTSRRAGARLKVFDVPRAGLDVLIVVHAPGVLVLGSERQALRVPDDGDSEPVMFELQANAPGAVRISVTAWQGGNYLGELPVEVRAARGYGQQPARYPDRADRGHRRRRSDPGGAL